MRITTLLLLATFTSLSAASADRRDDIEDDVDHEPTAGDVALGLDVDVELGAALGSSSSSSLLPADALRTAPAVAAVLEAAYEAAGLDRDPTRSWNRRARLAGLIPWLTVRTGWDASWRDEEPGEVGRGRTFEVRATWRLDRLLFNDRELQISSIDASRRRDRRRLASHVIRAYFSWKKVTALATRNPARYAIAAEAATAELDALTDGWFSESFTRRASPSRP